ncbi:hypothetical protein NUITMVA2_00500 [Aeromonas caviae]|uniref:hypothetical protein n=2 Tax=Aeromonas caviae TaxID=648 RepID=UPI001F40C151|nr:hypothetical protein [Aeromonas caviae]BDC84693.1 hypothetical protein NUITMVA2_00500 [Aeromonas caviae]
MISFKNRLSKLKDRRQGTRERVLLEKGMLVNDMRDLRTAESYERLSESDAVKYAVGAMAPVSHESTQVSIAEGERVAGTLISMLETAGIPARHEIQGSVALDIHIEGHSDVDMLILHSDIVLVQTPKLDGSSTSCHDKRPMTEIIRELRLESEAKLTSRYHAAKVDCTGSKSIALSGGSLQRKVDVVPGCWYDTHNYQRSRQKADRGVKIYDKAKHELYGNFPFLHMKRVNERDTNYDGNLKKMIRLMKNLVADMPDYKHNKAKALSSYDLAGIGYGMEEQLACPRYMPLALIERLRAHLKNILDNQQFRMSMEVPDSTRKIFDKPEKEEALGLLYAEVNDLAESIYKALFPLGLQIYNGQQLSRRQVQFF